MLLRWFADPVDVWEVIMEQDLECWSWQRKSRDVLGFRISGTSGTLIPIMLSIV